MRAKPSTCEVRGRSGIGLAAGQRQSTPHGIVAAAA
jgi:hypothetical protein